MSQLVPIRQFTETEIETIKSAIAPGLSDSELQLFVATAKRTGLDPFSRQIYVSLKEWTDSKTGERRRRINIASTVDGFRVVAERSGKYRGQVGPYWCGPDGKWVDVWIHRQPPVASKVGVKRSDFDEPLWAVARFEAYNQATPVWQKMPELMISKVAECLALRKAFPNDLSGIYSAEEVKTIEHDAQPVQRKTHEDSPREVLEEVPPPSHGPDQAQHLEAFNASEPMPDFGPEPDQALHSPETYRVTFGKFKGKTLGEIGMYEAANYVRYLQNTAQRDGKELSGGAEEFVTYARAWNEKINQDKGALRGETFER